MPPKHERQHSSDSDVPPRDKAEREARAMEEGHHERAGHKGKIETPSHQGKPKSVR